MPWWQKTVLRDKMSLRSNQADKNFFFLLQMDIRIAYFAWILRPYSNIWIYPVSSASLAVAGWRLAIVPLSTVDQLIKTQVLAQLTRLAMPMLRGTASPIRTLSKSRYGTWMDGNPQICVSGFPPYSTKTPRLFASTKHTVTTTTLTSHSYLAISGMATVVTTGIVLQIWNAGLWGYLVKVNGLTVSVCQ